MVAPESEVAIEFLSFCFHYILWVDNVLLANIPENSNSATALELRPSQPDTRDKDTLSDLSDISDESDNDTPTAETPLPNANTATPVQRQSARLKTQPTLDYQKIHQRRTANVKSHPSVPNNSPHSRPSQAFFQYALAYIPAQASQGFVRVAHKVKRSTPDLPSLKEAI